MYTVFIRKNETGVICAREFNFDWDDNQKFWWSEGNMACDCNRHLEFERACGVKEPGEIECGMTLYSVPFVELQPGERIPFED